MNSASSLTQPSSAEPRVCCQERPRKYRPGTSVTPRRWRMRPSSSRTGRSIQEWSGRYPVAQMTASTSSSLPSAKRTVRPEAPTARGFELDAEAALELARARADQRVAVAGRRPKRESTVLSSRPSLGQPPEQVAAEDPLGQRRLPRADGEVHRVRRRELLGDLKAGVAAADHEHACPRARRSGLGSRRCASGTPRARARRPARALIGTWNGPVATTTWSASTRLLVELEDEAAVAPPSTSARGCRARPAARTSARTARGRRPPRRGPDSRRDRPGTAGPGRRVIAARREEHERVPALRQAVPTDRPPRGSRTVGPGGRGSGRSPGRPGRRR